MFRFLFMVSALLASAFGATITRSNLFPNGRIVGGRPTTSFIYPYQVSLMIKSLIGGTFQHMCGGSVYSKRVIITAAHCLSGRAANRLRVAVGITSLSESTEHLKVALVAVNSNYNPNTIDFDVGLVVLSKPLVFGLNVQPITLAEINPASGTEAVVTGWGTTEEGGSLSQVLQEVTVEIVSNANCTVSYAGVNNITDNMLCAGVEGGGKDACQGDSGGPLAVDGVLVGTVSWGVGCARAGYPGVYTSIAELASWIIQTAALFC